MPEAGSVAEREAWISLFERSRDAATVCRRFGISRTTLRKWWLRYQAEGPAGLQDGSRTPGRSPGRKVFAPEVARIVALRAGGTTLSGIRAALAAEGVAVSVPTIRKVLARGADSGSRPQRRRAAPDASGLFNAILPDDAVFRGLAGQIAAGQIRPGERLTEERLCREFRVGRTRVRDALRSLALVGLVAIERNRGAVVATPSDQDVADAYAARRLVEGGLVRSLAIGRDPGHVEVLRQHLRRQSDAERRGDRVTLVRLLTEFHLLLASLAGNPFLRGFVETLATTTSLAVLLYDRADAPSCAVAEHRLLVRLIEDGRGEEAAVLMAQHLGHNQQRLERPGSGGAAPGPALSG